MGLLTCHDLVSSTLQHAAGTQATTLIGTCCCCCCCRNVRTSTPFKFQQIFCAALDLLQREATTALSCDPDGSILADYAASRSVSSYAVSHPYLVKLPHSMGGGNAEERNSLYGHNGMHGSALPLSESQQLHLDKKLLLSQDRASQLSQELLRQTNVEHASKANEMPVTSANQDNSSGRVLYGKQTGGRGGKRLQSWHDVLFLINWDLNDVAVCNLLHLFSRSNPVKQVLRRCFSVSVDRFLFALLRRVLTVPTPASFHGKQAGEQNGFSGSVQVTNPSFRPPVTLPHTSEKEAFQLDLVRCCLSSFCHLLFRTWASLAMTLEDPAPLLSKSRNSTRSHQEDSLGNEGSSRFCCACCVCSRAALTQRLFCSIHSHGGRALWNVVSKSPGVGGHCLFPRSIKASEEVSGVFLGMKSLLLPGLLMVWRDPRFPYVFPTEFLQSFDSLIHYTHREELHILRRQQRQATARFLNSQTWSSSGNTAAGAYGGTDMIGCSTTLKLGVMSLFLQAEHALKRGDIENMEKALGGEQHECADGKAAGVASATNDTRYLDLAKSITSSVAEALRPFHAAMLLRRFGPSRLPRRLYSEPAKVISEELGAILHEEYEVSGHLNEARDAATDFVANVCRWLWGSRMETNETRREQDRPHERFKAQEGSNRKDTLPCPEDDESGVWVWQFGSCVNGFSTRVSDVDICVLLAGNAAQLRGGSSGFAERGTRTPDEVNVQKHLHEIMLSWHGHDTEYGQAEKAVRLLGEVLERIKIAQNFDEDFESQDEQGKAGSVGQTPASEEPSDDKDAWQPRLKMDGIEIVPHARVPICRIDFLYGTFARTPSSTGQDSWSWQHVKTEVSFSNRLAILNSRYICRLAAQTPLSFTLAAAVKVWAQRRGLANAYRGYFSSYTWLLMAFHFLACREQPLIHNLLSPLPRMLKRANMSEPALDFWNGADNCWFYDPWVSASEQPDSRMKEALRQSTWHNRRRASSSISSPSLTSSFSSGFTLSGNGFPDPASNISAAIAVDGGRAIAQLLYEFFRFYAYEFNPYSHVISLRYNSPPPPLPVAKTKVDVCAWSPNGSVEERVKQEICWWTWEPQERGSALKARLPIGLCRPFGSGFSEPQGIFLRKIDLALWMGNPRVPVHRHQWKLMDFLPGQLLPRQHQEVRRNNRRLTVKREVSSPLSSDTHKFLLGLAAKLIGPAIEDEETPPSHVFQQRQWIQDWERVKDDHRKTFLKKYAAAGRKMDVLQFDTFVVEDPFRELELLQPKFEKQDRLCYELKRATHLLAAAASEEDNGGERANEAKIRNAQNVVEALFRPFDPVVESDMLRLTSDATRFMREELEALTEPDKEKEEAGLLVPSFSER